MAFNTKKQLDVAWDVYYDPVSIDVEKPARMVLTGSSGSGKTYVMNRILCELAQTPYQAVILDPKVVGFHRFHDRFHVFPVLGDDGSGLQTMGDQFLQVINNVYDEMMARYAYMARNHIDELPINEEFPILYMICDELNTLINTKPTLSNSRGFASFSIKDRLITISELARQANISFLFAGQTLSAEVLPTGVKNNLNAWMILKAEGAFQVKTVCPDGMEDELVGATSIPASCPGLGYWLTSSTEKKFGRHFVQARSYLCRPEDIDRTMEETKHLKAPMDWVYKGECFDLLFGRKTKEDLEDEDSNSGFYRSRSFR